MNYSSPCWLHWLECWKMILVKPEKMIFTEGNLNHEHDQFSPEKLSNYSNFNLWKVSRFYLLTVQIILISLPYQSKKKNTSKNPKFIWISVIYYYFTVYVFPHLNFNLISLSSLSLVVIEERGKFTVNCFTSFSVHVFTR